MLKSGCVAAAVLAVALFAPVGAKQAEAMPVAKPDAKEMALKHKVGRWGRRGFRGFRGRRFGGLRLRFGPRFYGRKFYYGGYYPRRRFYRPRLRYYYGGPAYYSRHSCRYLKKRFRYTGNPYWWHRYKRCKFGGYY